MRSRRPASEAEVVLCFLRGESESPRFGAATRTALEAGGGISLLTTPDLTSGPENAARAKALAATKGWGTGAGLFAGFPAGVTWSHAVLDADELQRVRYIDYSYWVELSGGSRRPADVAGTIASGNLPVWVREIGLEWCGQLAAALRASGTVAPLIVVGTPDLEQLVVLEGHARLTALFVGDLVGAIDVWAYVGTSPSITGWALF